MIGYIHSKESFGTVDGPGIRYVLFMQGCPMRCLYCHNPDTWKIGEGSPVTAEEVIEEIKSNKAFYEKGGITVSGGEPLFQLEFLTELFRRCKEENIHTCIDTSGITFEPNNIEYIKKINMLLSYTDLVMLDIKHIESESHKTLTGWGNENILAFAKHLEEKKVALWVRHVVVEGYSDKKEDLIKLGEFIGGLKNLKSLDVLPYHTMGVNKYKEMGIPYKLEGVPALLKADAQKAKEYILYGIRKARQLS